MKTELTPEEINKAAVSSEFKKAYWKIRVDAFESGARWAQSILTKQEKHIQYHCVSSDALVNGNPCGNWCGDNNCLGKNEHTQADDAIKEYLGDLDVPFNEVVEVYYPAIVGMVDELQSEIQSLKQANASLIECLMAISANSMDSWIIRMAVKELSKHDKQ